MGAFCSVPISVSLSLSLSLSIYIYIYMAFESTGSIPATGRYCLATLMSSDRMKQICLWMTIEIDIYIYIYISKNGSLLVTLDGVTEGLPFL